MIEIKNLGDGCNGAAKGAMVLLSGAMVLLSGKSESKTEGDVKYVKSTKASKQTKNGNRKKTRSTSHARNVN